MRNGWRADRNFCHLLSNYFLGQELNKKVQTKMQNNQFLGQRDSTQKLRHFPCMWLSHLGFSKNCQKESLNIEPGVIWVCPSNKQTIPVWGNSTCRLFLCGLSSVKRFYYSSVWTPAGELYSCALALNFLRGFVLRQNDLCNWFCFDLLDMLTHPWMCSWLLQGRAGPGDFGTGHESSGIGVNIKEYVVCLSNEVNIL